MSRTILLLAVAAMLCACVADQGTYLEIFIKWDNSISQTDKAEQAILEEIGRELCKVPTPQVKKIGHQDKSTTLNTESWGYYACTGSADQVTKATKQCQSGQRNFKDELEDRTTPDQEAEKITCTVKSGKVPTSTPKTTSGRRLMA
jgi:hypothetical protein